MKKIIIISLVVLLSIVAVFGIFIGCIHIGLPDKNPVVYGSENIVVPDTITLNDEIIKTMSFNIRCFAREDDKQNNWENRKEHVANTIKNYSPDIIGFQEVTHPQYKYLVENLGDTYNYAGIYCSGMGLKRGDILIRNTSPANNLFNMLFSSLISESTVVFYKKSRFELLDYQTLWLSETPNKPSKGWDALFKRTCTKLNLKDHYTGKEFTFMNTHFDHKGETARQNSIELIKQWAGEVENAVVVGDFNLKEKTDLYNNLTADILQDIKYLAPEENSDSGKTSNGYGNNNHTEPIDYIFIKSNDIEIRSYTIIRDTYGDNYYISDHFPIMGEILF